MKVVLRPLDKKFAKEHILFSLRKKKKAMHPSSLATEPSFTIKAYKKLEDNAVLGRNLIQSYRINPIQSYRRNLIQSYRRNPIQS